MMIIIMMNYVAVQALEEIYAADNRLTTLQGLKIAAATLDVSEVIASDISGLRTPTYLY
jgi:hypothetical protein